MSADLQIVPCSFREANAFVREHHRHHGEARGTKFCVGVAKAEVMVGVAMVGRPVARMLNDGWTLEVNRVATDGTRNACSALYSAAWRAAKALGYRRLVTYILDSEPGTSLKGAGWRCVGECGGGSWHRDNRPRVDTHPTQAKLRYEVDL